MLFFGGTVSFSGQVCVDECYKRLRGYAVNFHHSSPDFVGGTPG
ncbi:hypothetical protein ECPA7_0220 [Escherichia coli PA7]|nr:hypothetical protein ECPA7_0220 [Escherichia coli PA7]